MTPTEYGLRSQALAKDTGSGFGQAFAMGFQRSSPMYQLQMDQIKSNILDNQIRTQAYQEGIKLKTEEQTAWMQDAPQMAPWLTATPEKRAEMPPPVSVKSQKAATLLEQVGTADQRYFTAKEARRVSEESNRLAVKQQERLNSWEDYKAQLPEEARGQIDAMPDGGYVKDLSGKITGISPTAMAFANSKRTSTMLPFGVTKQQVAPTSTSKMTAAQADANAIAEYDQKAKELTAAGDAAGAAKFKGMADNIRGIRHLRLAGEAGQFITDPVTGDRLYKEPGYAPIKMPDAKLAADIKAALYDVYEASRAYSKAKSENADTDTLMQAIRDKTAARKTLNAIFANRKIQLTPEPQAAPTNSVQVLSITPQ